MLIYDVKFSILAIMAMLVHPAIEDLNLAHILYALGDETRLAIICNLHYADGPLTCSEAVAGIADLPVSSRSYSFQVLRQAGLIRSERRGRECYNHIRREDLATRFPGVMDAILARL